MYAFDVIKIAMNLNFKFQLEIMLMDGSLVVNIAMADGLGRMDHQ